MLTTKSQSGATLFIGLVLLLAISIISLAAMRTSILDLTLANNKQQYTNTFEAAERVINSRLPSLTLNLTGTELPNDVLTTATQTNTSINSINAAGEQVKVANVNSEVIYRFAGGVTGEELTGRAYHFQMNTEAQAPGRGANANHRVGFYIVAPGN